MTTFLELTAAGAIGGLTTGACILGAVIHLKRKLTAGTRR